MKKPKRKTQSRIMRNIRRKQCLPFKESTKRQLTKGTLPNQPDLDIGIIHVDSEELKQLETLKSKLAYLPESYLQRGSSAKCKK